MHISVRQLLILFANESAYKIVKTNKRGNFYLLYFLFILVKNVHFLCDIVVLY